MIRESQAAVAVECLLPALATPFEAWVMSPGELIAFLQTLSRGGYEQALSHATIFNNPFERDRGQQLISQFRAAREIDGADLARAADASGLSYRVLLQMLPFVALLMIAALRNTLEQPARDILARRMGKAHGRTADPFADLAELVSAETKGDRGGLFAGMLMGLLGRRQTEAEAIV